MARRQAAGLQLLGCVFRSCDLRSADFRGTTFFGCDPTGASYDRDTFWPCPEGTRFDRPAAGARLVEEDVIDHDRANAPQPAAPDGASEDWFDRWLSARTSSIGPHALLVLSEQDSSRPQALNDLLETARSHYIDPATTASRLARLGAPRTAALFQELLPATKKAQSGDVGEILATEIAERKLAYQVPIRRLRWKDGRNMALRGDDIVGLKRDDAEVLHFLKGESKSRALLATNVINEAAEALDGEAGRPTRHAVLFVAERLRERSQDHLAEELEDAVLASFQGRTIEHLLFVVAGNDPERLLSAHLAACSTTGLRRHAVAVHLPDHQDFIGQIFGAL